MLFFGALLYTSTYFPHPRTVDILLLFGNTDYDKANGTVCQKIGAYETFAKVGAFLRRAVFRKMLFGALVVILRYHRRRRKDVFP